MHNQDYSQWEYTETQKAYYGLLKKLSERNEDQANWDSYDIKCVCGILKSLHYIHKCKEHREHKEHKE